MHKVLFLILYLLLSIIVLAEKSPHGPNLKMNCTVCHVTENWEEIKSGEFNHNKTHFPLVGQHKTVSCRSCHTNLDFSKAKTSCVSCHKDMHQGTVGQDCAQCHTPKTWIVNNIKQIHQQRGFVLLGAHATVDCAYCHKSASQLRFENINTDCYACHKAQYYDTFHPNHIETGFSTDCARCHNMTGIDWSSNGKGFDHGFFPLMGAHKISCDQCHIDNDFKTRLSSACISCHYKDALPIAITKYPAHSNKFLSYSCDACHSTTSWTPIIKFTVHDSFGKIYSGRHNGEWGKCTDCHNNDAAFKANCRKCHKFDSSQKSMD